MFSLSNYFAKFKNLEKDKGDVLNEVIDSIQKICGFVLVSEEILVEEGIAQINASPLKRNEIFMHKEAILLELNSLSSKIKEIK